MPILLLLFSLLAYSEDFSSEKYCFSSVQQGQLAKRKFEGLQVPSDKVTEDENCLSVQMRPHRRELIQRFFLSEFPSAKITFSSEEIRREPCRLKVEKEKVSQGESLSAGAGSNITVTGSTVKATGTDVMSIQTLKDFVFMANEDEIKGRCRAITPDRYEIKISVVKDPKLPHELLPPRSILVTNTPPPPQDLMFLHTELQLKRGERVEIGSIIKNLRDKAHTASSAPSLRVEAGKHEMTEKVFLRID